MSITKTTASPIHGEAVYAATPAIARVRNTSSGAYATDDSASEANTGSAIRFGRRVSERRSEWTGRPTSRRLAASVSDSTDLMVGRASRSARGHVGRHPGAEGTS